MAEIALTRGLFTVVDDADHGWLSAWKWRTQGGRHPAAVRAAYDRGNAETIYMHRIIMNAPDGRYVDHINGNALDNRRCNLRLCSHAENSRNQRLRRDSTTGFKGVRMATPERFDARIRFNYKPHYLGSFRTAEEAARAYDAAAIRLHGEFARLNFPLVDA